jgi:hypothetical protein
MQSVITCCVSFMQSFANEPFILCVIILNVIMLNIFMLSAVAPYKLVVLLYLCFR